MQRKRVTNYEYINLLVQEVKACAANGTSADDAFQELCLIYQPLLRGIVVRITKKHIKMAPKDIYIIILGIFYRLILRYDGTFTNTKANVVNYTGVYFSSYLKKTLYWEIYRLLSPNKRETDNLEKDIPYMEVSALVKTNSRRLICYDAPKGINPDFIGLCQKLRKNLGSDVHADMMFLLYGYDAKVKDLSRIFKLSAARTTKYVGELHDFWTKPENGIVPER